LDRSRVRRRYVLLGVAAGVAALAIAAGAWLALATPAFKKIGPGLMFKSSGGGPLVTYSEPGAPAEAVAWDSTGGTRLQVREVKRDYALDDGTQLQATIRVVEDATGNRWLQAAEGTSGFEPSPDHSLYFFVYGHQMYLVSAASLEITRLTSWGYHGKSVYQLAQEQGRIVHWVYHPLWAPDGQSVVFGTDRSGRHEVWRVDAVDRQETVLVDSGDRGWLPSFWSDDGRLVVQYVEDRVGSDYLLVDLQSGASEFLVHGAHSDACPPFIVTFDDVEQTAGLLLYDVDQRTSARIPPPPDGFMYQLPLVASPSHVRIAAWLANKSGSRILGVLNLNANPISVTTYPEPPAGRGGRVMWLDDETVAVQRGDKHLLNSATFSLNVGGAK